MRADGVEHPNEHSLVVMNSPGVLTCGEMSDERGVRSHFSIIRSLSGALPKYANSLWFSLFTLFRGHYTFQADGSLCTIKTGLQSYMKNKGPEDCIERHGPRIWPTTLPITPWGSLLWSLINTKIYSTPLRPVKALKSQ